MVIAVATQMGNYLPTVIFLFIAAAVYLMWDVERNASCRYCDHCKKVAKDKQEKRDKETHEAYHRYAGGLASKCNDPKCKGR